MNGTHHEDLTACACQLAAVPADKRAGLIDGAKRADYLEDVFVQVTFAGERPTAMGRTLTSLQHFQTDGGGYLWDADKSLGPLEELGDVAMTIARAHVSGQTPPMRKAVQDQPKAVFGGFRFPSAAAVGSYWSTAPAYSKECGHALHFVQDACVPHHVWGLLLWGHQEWEDDIEERWIQHRAMLEDAGENHVFCEAVRAELAGITAKTVEDLIKSNAEWAASWFGQPHRMGECDVTDMLAVCIRAVASSIAAINIMKGQE